MVTINMILLASASFDRVKMFASQFRLTVDNRKKTDPQVPRNKSNACRK